MNEGSGPTLPFDAVYREERLAVTRLAYLLVRSTAIAEELAQEAFLRLYERFDAVRNPAGFLRTAVVRLAATWLRRDGMEHHRLALATAGDHRERAGPEVDEMWEALGRLRPERRIVLVLRFYEDLSHDRIAELLECSAATVRSRTRRALADLRKEMSR